MSKLTTELMVASLTGALNTVKKFLSSEDFEELLDNILNGAESYFKENSTPDVVIELVCSRLRERFGVEDSKPDN